MIVLIILFLKSLNVVEISRDSSLVSAGFSDSSIKIWDVNQTHTRTFGTVVTKEENGQKISKTADKDYDILYGHSGPIYGLSFSPDNKFLLSSSEDSTGN